MRKIVLGVTLVLLLAPAAAVAKPRLSTKRATHAIAQYEKGYRYETVKRRRASRTVIHFRVIAHGVEWEGSDGLWDLDETLTVKLRNGHAHVWSPAFGWGL